MLHSTGYTIVYEILLRPTDLRALQSELRCECRLKQFMLLLGNSLSFKGSCSSKWKSERARERERGARPLQLEEIHLPHATLIVPRPADALLLLRCCCCCATRSRATRTSEKFIEDAFAVNAEACAGSKWACRGKVCGAGN